MIAIPLGVAPDGSVGGLLAACSGGERRLRRRWVTQCLLVGDQIVGQLCRVGRDLWLRARGSGRRAG